MRMMSAPCLSRALLLQLLVLCVLLGLLSAPAASSSPAVSARPPRVHIVAHTHDDVGWLKTVDQYYYGLNLSISATGVQYVLSSVVAALLAEPERRFVLTELVYVERWWREQSARTQAAVRGLVRSGQLQFVNGGWCMHDEATSHYVDMVDQTTLGHRFLLRAFGPDANPTVGWQLDPFGHSFTQAALLSRDVGFDALYFGRLDWQEKEQRLQAQSMEWWWQTGPGDGAGGGGDGIFTGALVQASPYSPPPGFCFECGDAAMVMDADSAEYNAASRGDEFIRYVLQWMPAQQGDDFMVTVGGDFQYENAFLYFLSLDRLIAAVNADGRVNASYSTPQAYTAARLAAGLPLPVRTGDLMPYADGYNSYWTGYFSSRALLKRYARINSAYLQAARQLLAFDALDARQARRDGADTGSSRNVSTDATTALWRALAAVQHHDAIAGTQKQHVAYDNARQISSGYDAASQAALALMQRWTQLSASASSPPSPPLQHCPLSNISVCPVSQQSAAFVLVVYNALPQPRVADPISLPLSVSGDAVDVTDSDGRAVAFTVLPTANHSALQPQSAPFTLHFNAHVPPLGFTTYHVTTANHSTTAAEEAAQRQSRRTRKGSSAGSGRLGPVLTVPLSGDVSIENEYWRLSFDAQSGLLSSATDLQSGAVHPLSQQFGYYESYAADDDVNSGAYLFRPVQQSAVMLPAVNGSLTLQVQTGPTLVQVVQRVTGWLLQTVRLTRGSPDIEFSYAIGPVPIDDGVGKEVITRFSSAIASGGEFWTDSNGRELQRRQRDRRSQFNYSRTDEPVSSNYYPVTTVIALQDNTTGLSVVVDRAMGGSSLRDGQLELMLHRRILHDDGEGVAEPLNETTEGMTHAPDWQRLGVGVTVLGSLRLSLTAATALPAAHRPLAARVYQPLIVALASTQQTGGPELYRAEHRMAGSKLAGAADGWSEAVDLMTLQQLEDGELLLRLSHRFAVGENAALSQPQCVNLSSLLPPTTTLTEVSLTTNQNISALRQRQARMNWTVAGKRVDASISSTQRHSAVASDCEAGGGVSGGVLLQPMQVRTFMLSLG